MQNSSEKIIFAPIKSKRTFEEICSEIKKLIISGILRPGNKLPSESELARQFSVGRQTIREALRILELSGFITVQRGSTGGAIIIDTVLSKISDLLLNAFQMKKISIDELTTARLEVERTILGYVITNAGDDEINNLQENIVQAEKEVEAGIHPFTTNSEFHNILAKSAKNSIFVIVEASIMTVVTDFLSRLTPDFEGSRRTIKEHQSILDAIRRRDSQEASRVLEKHILDVGSRFQGMIEQIYDR